MRATIFDCDGTLVDSELLGNEVLVECVRELGHDLTLSDAVRDFRGIKLATCVEQLEARFRVRLPHDFVPRFRSRMDDAFRARLQPMDGAADLVRSVHGPKCVASSAPREKVELSLSLTGLLSEFAGRIFSSYDIGSWKPEPGVFLHAAHALEVAPHECTVVEDSVPGALAGIAAGMRVISYQPHGRDPALPDGVTVVEHLSEVSDLLKEVR